MKRSWSAWFPFGISAKKLNATHEKWVVMVRPSLMRDYARSGVAQHLIDEAVDVDFDLSSRCRQCCQAGVPTGATKR